MEVKFKSITVGQWDGNTGMTYTIIGLSEEGKVYRYSVAKRSWVEMPTTSDFKEAYEWDEKY